MRSYVLTALAAGGLAACAPPALDQDSDHVKTWAVTGSAVGVFANVYEPLAYADGHSTFHDPACPVTTDDGTTAHVTGGCTDSTGDAWIGSATITRATGGDRTVTLDGFGHGSAPSHASGTAHFHPTSATMQSFDVSLTLAGGITTTIGYTGTVSGTYTGPTTWNGSGMVTREGGVIAPHGTVSVMTMDEVWDSATCSGEPMSGTTTVTGSGHIAVVTYDGATACDAMHSAAWKWDGVDQGLVQGISCDVRPGLRGGAAWTAALFALAALVVVRRRSRR